MSAKEDETFRRLHNLIRSGYAADFSDNGVDDAIWLSHPGDAPDLILYSSGMLVSLDKNIPLNPKAKEDGDRIYNEMTSVEDNKIFDLFISHVPKPSWRQRTRKDREKYVWMPLTTLGCVGAYLIFVWIISAAWRILTGE